MVRSMPDLGGEPLYAGHSTPIFVPHYLRPLSAPWTGRQASLIHPLLMATEMCSGSSSQMHQSERWAGHTQLWWWRPDIRNHIPN